MRVGQAQDAPEGVVRGDAVGVRQMLAQPVDLQLGPVGDRDPAVGATADAAQRREHQLVQRTRPRARSVQFSQRFDEMGGQRRSGRRGGPGVVLVFSLPDPGSLQPPCRGHDIDSVDHSVAGLKLAALAERLHGLSHEQRPAQRQRLHAQGHHGAGHAALAQDCQSYSRPRVRDDNVFAESLFPRAKYCPDFLACGRFKDLQAAGQLASAFVRWHNHDHCHGEIRFVSLVQGHAVHDRLRAIPSGNVWPKHDSRGNYLDMLQTLGISCLLDG